MDNRYAKDIKTALLAADTIVNKWGFKDYKLEVYGALDRSPSYTTDCQEIIATKSLRHNVTLKGEADPMFVLARTVSRASPPSNMSRVLIHVFAVGVSQFFHLGRSSPRSGRGSTHRCSCCLH